ncbi:MAG TPA: type II toxin-antitoxin system Phd/YefM family antitoxin [Caulobacteraceae bacterium]|jgi:antitoxin (DNA-binding transcriptional repressor) of toxin-antitoxin stability system
MSTHSVADAKAHLSNLIDRAMDGEAVVITRHGQPVVELKALTTLAPPMSKADLDWLRSRRLARRIAGFDPGVFVSQMRDEDDERLLRR